MPTRKQNEPPNQRPPAVRRHAGLEAPQFRLSTLMVLVTVLCVLLAGSMVLPPLVTFALVLLLLAIVAHVAGNYYGTKLRDGATELARQNREHAANAEQRESGHDAGSGPRSRLTDKAPIGIMLGFAIVTGAGVAVSVGSYWLTALTEQPLVWGDYLVSGIAFGVLGGLFGFMLGGFVCIGYRAWSDAIREVPPSSIKDQTGEESKVNS